MKPTVERLRQLFAYDPETGSIYRDGKETARCLCTGGYRCLSIDGKTYTAHPVVWAIYHGEWPARDVDHRNGVRSDNRINNLRLATEQQNNYNAKPRKSKTGIKGVENLSGSWRAYIVHNRKKIHLGTFETEALAREFRQLAADMLHGEYVRHA